MENKSKSLRSGITRVELILVILVAAVLYSVFFSCGCVSRPKARASSCQSNLKQLALGMTLYAQDYGEGDSLINPSPQCRSKAARELAKRKFSGWNDSVRYYIKSERILFCPAARGVKEPTYAINRHVNTAKMLQTEYPNVTVMLFESIPGKNLSGGMELLPKNPRHSGYNNVVFFDGHALPVKPEDMASFRWNPSSKH